MDIRVVLTVQLTVPQSNKLLCKHNGCSCIEISSLLIPSIGVIILLNKSQRDITLDHDI